MSIGPEKRLGRLGGNPNLLRQNVVESAFSDAGFKQAVDKALGYASGSNNLIALSIARNISVRLFKPGTPLADRLGVTSMARKDGPKLS